VLLRRATRVQVDHLRLLRSFLLLHLHAREPLFSELLKVKLVFLQFQRVGLLKALVHLFFEELVFWAEQSLFQFCFAERWEFEFAFWLWFETGIRLARTSILQAEFAEFGATESAVGRLFVFFVRVSLHTFVASPVRVPRRQLELFEHVVVTRKPVKPPVQTASFRILRITYLETRPIRIRSHSGR